jgi:signal transduction histidine kinase
LRENDQAVLTTGKTMQTLETIPHDDGEHYYMSFKFPITDRFGRQLLAGMSIDITEQKRLEAQHNQLLVREQSARRQAEAANRAKDEFLAMVSHELRTPLGAILGWAELVRHGNLDEATTNKALAVIERNAQVQNQLIKDLLDTAQIVQGQLCLLTRPTSLVQVIEAALDTVRLTADTKMIHLEFRLDSSVGLVNGDPDRLQQVVWNLLSNAVKFTPSGGRVAVRLLRVDDCAQIKVTDTGIGISRDFLPYVFERFRQSENSRSSGGLGLGLAIVRKIVELHGGTIQAESRGLGQGATFMVQLPLVEPAGYIG